MSRVGMSPIDIPSGVDVKIDDHEVTVKGSLGELSHTISPGLGMELDDENNTLTVTRSSEERDVRSLHGLHRSLIANMIEGVSKGVQKKMEIHGTGYNVNLRGNQLVLQVGFCHEVRFDLPENIEVDLVYDKDDYTVRADPTRIQQVMMNLATNARDAMPQGGKLHIALGRISVSKDDTPLMTEMEAGEWVCVSVTDTGTGIPNDVLPQIYDPFFTTKEPGKGTGLGLAQVYGIVRQHEGHIDVHTKEGRGTTFLIYLPALTLNQPDVPVTETERLPQGEGQTILVVEDGAITRAAVVDSLRLLGYQALEATNGKEALAVFERHADQIALVLSDVVMPKMGGQALFHTLKQQDPNVKVMLLSGHPPHEKELEDLRALGLAGWLSKPPNLEQLAEAIAQVLGQE